jgi:ribose 5-phosphate isomerase A
VTDLSPADRAKRAAAARAVELVEDGMRLGLGTGSTARWFVDLLAEHLRETGKTVVCVPTSSATRAQAERLGIPLATLDEAVGDEAVGDTGALDLAVDGADEIEASGGRLALIKGGGGALLQEKIVAAASRRFVVVADATKKVEALGAFDLPVEVVRFGWRSTAGHIARALAEQDVAGRGWRLREGDGAPFLSDEGHHIIDLALGRIGDPAALDRALGAIPGVVETGLFVGMAAQAILGQPDGTVRIVESAPA